MPQMQSASDFPYATQLYTQAMYNDELAAGMENPSYNVGQRFFDPQMKNVGGDQMMTMKDKSPFNYTDYKSRLGVMNDWGSQYGPFLAALAVGGVAAGGLAGAGAMSSGLTEGAVLASETGFVPGSFEIGQGAGLDAAGANAAGGTGMYSANPGYQSTYEMLMGRPAGPMAFDATSTLAPEYAAGGAAASSPYYAPSSDGGAASGSGFDLQSVMNNIFGNSSGGNGGGFLSKGGPWSNAFDLGSNAYGLFNSYQNKKKMEELARNADPMGPYRAQYAQQLSQLMANPKSITSRPGYQFRFDQGQQAAQRAMAAQGYNASGNEKIALTQYGQNFASGELNQEIARLQALAGGDPANAARLRMEGMNNNTQMTGNVLGSLGYNIYRRGW